MRRTAWTAADVVGATEWLEMGGKKKPLVMSELGCADGCGRQMGAENCADGCRWREGKWVRRIARTAADGVGAREWLEMGGEKKPLMSELGCADGCGREMDEESGDEGAWLRRRLRMGNGCGEVRGQLRRRGCKGVAGNGWGMVGRRSRW